MGLLLLNPRKRDRARGRRRKHARGRRRGRSMFAKLSAMMGGGKRRRGRRKKNPSGRRHRGRGHRRRNPSGLGRGGIVGRAVRLFASQWAGDFLSGPIYKGLQKVLPESTFPTLRYGYVQAAVGLVGGFILKRTPLRRFADDFMVANLVVGLSASPIPSGFNVAYKIGIADYATLGYGARPQHYGMLGQRRPELLGGSRGSDLDTGIGYMPQDETFAQNYTGAAGA